MWIGSKIEDFLRQTSNAYFYYYYYVYFELKEGKEGFWQLIWLNWIELIENYEADDLELISINYRYVNIWVGYSFLDIFRRHKWRSKSASNSSGDTEHARYVDLSLI